MDIEFFRQQALLARDLAEKADPFTRKRLLALAKGYDAKAGAARGRARQEDTEGRSEVKCDACDGRGHPSVQAVAPGRRIYPAPCKKCSGKGRLRLR